MRKLLVSLLILSSFSVFVNAQNQQITIEDVFGSTFRTRGMDALHSLNNGTQYTVLQHNRKNNSVSVEMYNYATSTQVATVVSSSNLPGNFYFTSYEFSNDESKLLLGGASEPIYRHSQLGTYYVYDIKTKVATLVFDKKIQEPTLSPDASKVAFVHNNNIYVKDLSNGAVKQITTDGVKNQIINGITDWVYEEEFGFVRAFEWNTNGSKLAFIRFDEREVPEFSMDIYGNGLYPTQQVFKYPKAGEANSNVSLHVYDISSKETVTVALDNPYYIPRIKWTNESNILSVRTLNRHQNELDLIFYNAANNTSELILKETDKAYVDVTDDLTFLADNSFIWTSEKSGHNHIYHYSKTGKLINQVTSGNWEVTSYYGYDVKSKQIFYQSVENGSIIRDVYTIGLNGKNKKRLSAEIGTNSAKFSANFSLFINTYSSITTPPRYTLHRSKDGKMLKEIVNNTPVLEKLMEFGVTPKEFSTISVNGYDLNMWTIKPNDFNPDKKYPVLMFQYSGPGSQQVANRWYSGNDYWHFMLAQQGYIVVCVDGRGTGFKGAKFKKITQKELGKFEVEDQIAAAKKLGELPYVDANRIGIWGWSYGGFMSSNAILKGNEVFKAAIAVAPVTSWRFYDTVYTERYMTTPQENPSGYDQNSPIYHVDKLKGNYLLIHGSADDNVHVQNTMVMIEALVQANKQFEWAIYPDKNHGIYGGNTRIQLYTKMTEFLKENL